MKTFTREQGAVGLVANFGYNGGEVVQNDFNSKYPWNSITKLYDEKTGNYWVRIPKFYTKYTLDDDGYIKERYVSQYRVDKTWHLNPVFVDKNGKDLPFVEVAAYQLSIDALTNQAKSVPNVMAAGGTRTAEALRSIVEIYEDINDGYDYELYNIWADIMLQDLYLIEFARIEKSTLKYDDIIYGNRGARVNNGQTDSLLNENASGVVSAKSNTNCLSPMRYRYIENIFGNGIHFIDGITITNGVITVKDNTGTKTSSLKAVVGSGYVHKLAFDNETKLVYPAIIAEKGQAAYGDGYEYSGGTKMLFKGWNSQEYNSMFNYNLLTNTTSNANITCRMIRYTQR